MYHLPNWQLLKKEYELEIILYCHLLAKSAEINFKNAYVMIIFFLIMGY